MSVEQPAGAAPLRFNPFAFVTDSTFRFGLLILAVVGSALYLTSPWGFALLPQARAADASLSCLGPALQPRTPAPIGGIADIADRLSEPDRRITGTPCSNALLRRLPGYRGLAMVVVGFAVGILLAALAIYWLTPPWLIRRRRLVPVPAAEMADLAASLAGLCDEVGVREVTFLVDPIDPSRNGLAFGRRGRRYVLLSRGLLHCFSHDHEIYRTVVLHELAHVHNRDLDRTFLTVAVWRAFVAIAVVPMGLAIALRLLLLPGGLQARTTDLQVAWRLVALAVLVLLIRNAVLRSRELYADIRTAEWGAGDTLRRLFAEPAGAPVPAGAVRRLTASVLWAFHTHPEPGVRREVVTGAVVPLDAGPWDGAVLGVVATFAAESIQLTAAWLEGGGWNDRLLSIASLPVTLLIAVPLAMACGIVVSRVVMAAQVTGIPFGLDRFAVGLGVGLVAGAVLGPSAASLPPGVALRGQPALAPGSWALWIALAVALCLFSVRWLEVVARIWLPRIRGRVSANWLPALVGSAAAVVIGVWLPLLLEFPVFVVIGHELVFPDLPETAVAATVIVLVLPTAAGEALGRLAGLPDAGLLALLTGLWVVPLVGSLLTRGDAAALPGWAALDPIPSGRRFVVARLRPGGAVRVGLLTSAVVVLTLAAGYGVLFTWVRGTRALAVLVVLLPIGVTVLASVVSAARAAASAAELRSLHGLIAASVGSAATLVGSHAALTLSSCTLLRACVPPISYRSTASLVLAYSILVGSVAAWLAGAVIERRRERGGASVSGRGPGRWARLSRRLALVLGGVVIVVLAEGLAVVTLGLASFAVIPLLLLAGGTGVGLWSGRVGLLGAFVVVMGANGTIALLVPSAAVLVLFVLLSHLVAIGVGYGVGRRVRRALSRP